MPQFKRSYWRYIILILLFVGLYGLLPQLGSFHKSLHLLGQAKLNDLGLATAAVLATYLAAAGTYYFLAFKPLAYGRTVLVQLAVMFINRLLPAGIGGIGANYRYLRRNKHTEVEAGAVVAVNNLTGIVGHSLLFWGLLAVFHSQLPKLHWSGSQHKLVIGLVVVVVLAGLYALLRSKRGRRVARGISRELRAYRSRPARLSLALLSSVCLTLTNVAALYFAMLSLGAHLTFVNILLVFSLGLLLGTATPTPGGLGGVEAGLVAGLVAYNLSGSQALAIVLAYRLVSFWLTLVIGAVALLICRRQKYL